MVKSAPESDLSHLCAAAITGSLESLVADTSVNFIPSTFPTMGRMLNLYPEQLRKFQERVGTELKKDLAEFLGTKFAAELSQLLEARNPNPALLRQKATGLVQGASKQEIAAMMAKATKLAEAQRNPQPQAPTQRPGQQAAPRPGQPAPAAPQQAPPVAQMNPAEQAQKQERFLNACLAGNAEVVTASLAPPSVNVNCQQQGQGWTGLMNATLQGHEAIVNSLIQTGANLNLQDDKGYTALMYACAYQRYKIVEILVRAGCDLQIKDKAGRDAAQYASIDPQVQTAINKARATPAPPQQQPGFGRPPFGQPQAAPQQPGFGQPPPQQPQQPPQWGQPQQTPQGYPGAPGQFPPGAQQQQAHRGPPPAGAGGAYAPYGAPRFGNGR